MTIDWKKDIEQFMKEFGANKNLTNVTNSDIIIEYYKSKDVSDEEMTKNWLFGLAEEKYPPYTTAYKYIKELRKQNPLWTKTTKD
jgi:FMN phosphatase YigB (HAD superfamily)